MADSIYKRFTKRLKDGSVTLISNSYSPKVLYRVFKRLCELEEKIEKGEFVTKEWHDEQIHRLKEDIKYLKEA